MNRPRPFARSGTNLFKPAAQFLNNLTQPTTSAKPPKRLKRRQSTLEDSLDDTEEEDIEQFAAMERTSHSSKNSGSGSELQPGAVPLIDISRTPSPYPRSRSAAQSEDEDDDFEMTSSIRPLVSHDVGRGSAAGSAAGGAGWRGIWRPGGLGAFFFGTWAGWQVWVGLLVFWVGGCGFGLLLMNRFLLWTGVYKFPFPLAATYIQLVLTHVLLLGSASLTRVLAGPLRKIGLGAAIAPSLPAAPPGGAYRNSSKGGSPFVQFGRWLANGSGGIAGGGIFEFNRAVAKQVLPLAAIYLGKVVLSNISFAYAQLPIYQLARIGVVPLTLIFSALAEKETYSTSTLSSALVATINLFMAALRPNIRVSWDSIVAGVFSSFFTAYYPILLLKTYRKLVAGLIPQGDVLTGYPSSNDPDSPSNREETRAYWRTLHYTSLLSIALFTPIVLLSGEPVNILRNCYILDVPFFWFLVWCGAIGSWAVFASTLLLVKATSPLTANFVGVPRGAFQLVMLQNFKMPVHAWVGVAMCWAGSVWFLGARRKEGRGRDRLRLEGR